VWRLLEGKIVGGRSLKGENELKGGLLKGKKIAKGEMLEGNS
jgi:hypothetical protein